MACEWISIFRAALNENWRFILSNFILYEIWKSTFNIKGLFLTLHHCQMNIEILLTFFMYIY